MFFKSSKKQSQNLVADLSPLLADIVEVDESHAVREWLDLNGNTLNVTLPFACESLHSKIEYELKQHANDMVVKVRQRIPSFDTPTAAVTNIQNIIAIASGKGGVGKSATAVNIAFALMQEGAKVGLLDADIYGPSLPTMLGNKGAHPDSSDNKTMFPLQSHGLVANSIGYLVSDEDAAIWRGPMASRALLQLINETRWPVLDYLIVDMPPGTGDVQLTMAQQVPLTGAVVVTTPQDLALADAQKGIAMFAKVATPVLGLVENMSGYACTACGHVEPIFSQGGGESLATRYDVPLLGTLPLSMAVRLHADTGTPLILKSAPDLLTL